MADTQRYVAIGLLAAALVAGAVVLFIPEDGTSLLDQAGHFGDLFEPNAVPGILVLTSLLAPLFALGGLGLAFLRKGLGFVLGLLAGLAHANVVALILVNDGGKLFLTSAGTPFYLLCAASVLGVGAGIVGMLAPPAAPVKKRSDVVLPPSPVLSAENPNAFNPLASREPRPFKPDPPREFREFQVTTRPPGAPDAPPAQEMSSWDEIPDEPAKPAAAPAPPAKPAGLPVAKPAPKPAAAPAAKPAAAAPLAKQAAAPAAKPAASKPAAPAGPAKPAAKPPAKQA
ncbi:MAG: hypothetical protein QOD77_706 [Thermoplasmata archaeon]|nr:hypothetical protein [Thermoplasmata archaeon]